MAMSLDNSISLEEFSNLELLCQPLAQDIFTVSAPRQLCKKKKAFISSVVKPHLGLQWLLPTAHPFYLFLKQKHKNKVQHLSEIVSSIYLSISKTELFPKLKLYKFKQLQRIQSCPILTIFESVLLQKTSNNNHQVLLTVKLNLAQAIKPGIIY